MMAMLASESPREAFERVKASKGDVLLESVGYVFLRKPQKTPTQRRRHLQRRGVRLSVTPEAHAVVSQGVRLGAAPRAEPNDDTIITIWFDMNLWRYTAGLFGTRSDGREALLDQIRGRRRH
jgi:hypothetical protein